MGEPQIRSRRLEKGHFSHSATLVFDGFLTSDVTVPIEVFGAASKKAWFLFYDVVVISTPKDKEVVSEEGVEESIRGYDLGNGVQILAHIQARFFISWLVLMISSSTGSDRPSVRRPTLKRKT